MATIEELINSSHALITESKNLKEKMRISSNKLDSYSQKIVHLTKPSQTGRLAAQQVSRAAGELKTSMGYTDDMKNKLEKFIRERQA